uniref:Uncharacterized protein n=1 Tax=Anguilla anguilla TaxID=7936 RepID=A0A0E9TN98_ANGAN
MWIKCRFSAFSKRYFLKLFLLFIIFLKYIFFTI